MTRPLAISARIHKILAAVHEVLLEDTQATYTKMLDAQEVSHLALFLWQSIKGNL